MAVMLPEGEDLNEALQLTLWISSVRSTCFTGPSQTSVQKRVVQSCQPEQNMSITGQMEQTLRNLLSVLHRSTLITFDLGPGSVDDETLFPSNIGVPFPKNFMSVPKTALKRLFRVYAHVYHQQVDPVIQLQEEAQLNTSFKHFIFFVHQFTLIDRRELAPLQELIEKLTSKDR